MTKCPQCGATTNPSQRFCGECGTRLQHAAKPQPTDDRNAVPHRPGGGRPDPWEVGASGEAGDGEDDFFSRYRPKSAVSGEDKADLPEPAQPRRSRRRFEPDLTDRSGPPTPPSVPPLFPQRADDESVKPAPSPQRSQPAPSAPATSPFSGMRGSDQAQQQEATRLEAEQRAAQDYAAREHAQREQEALQRTRHEQEQRVRQEQLERERRAAEERALQVQAVREQQAAREAAARDQAQQQSQRKPTPQQELNQQLPWLPPTSGEAGPQPDDASFTQLISGLDNDPADKPIVADGFDKTGIVPLPPREQDSVDQAPSNEAELQAQQRAAEFYGTAPTPSGPPNQPQMPSLPPLNAGPWAPAQAGSAQQEGAAQNIEQKEGQSPFSSPFVTEATTPETVLRNQASEPTVPRQSAEASSAKTEDEEFEREGFWPFGDELDDQQSQASQPASQRNRYQAGAGSAAGAPGTAPDFGAATGVGGGAGFGGGSGPGGAGGGPGRGSSGDESEQKRRGLRTILIAAVAAVVVILGAFAVSGLFRGGEEEAPVADDTQQEQGSETAEQPVDPDAGAESPTEDVETPEPANFEPVAFQSGSGNLRCQITPEGGAACQILEQNFSTPDEACTEGGNAGVAVGVNEEGITWPCLTSNFGGGEVLEYDEPVTAGDYTCSINFTTGVTCENTSGASFSLEFSAGVETNGDTAPEPQFELEPIE